MVDKTKQKILDAALKVFASDGYKSATTRGIAKESGFTEITLFRKFGTKKKLYEEAMLTNHAKLQENVISIISDLDQKIDDPKKFLEIYIEKMAAFFKDNIEFFNLMVTEDNIHIDNDMGEFSIFMGKFIERNIKNSEIEAETLAITINTYLYMLNLGIYRGFSSIRIDDRVKHFTDNLLMCF